MTLDALADYELQAPELSESLQKRLHTKLPYYYSVKNPVDLTGSSTAEQFAFAMNTMIESDEIDGLIVIPLFMTPLLDAEQVSQAIVEASEQRKKPILVVSVPSTMTIREHMFKLRLAGVPAYHLPLRGARGMAALVEYGEILRRPTE
jgi:acyl-CoA synthetase (NDP forming)